VRLALALGALALTGCSSTAPLVTVQQLLAQCATLKGKQVRVAGYVGQCGGYDCTLFADKTGPAAFQKSLADSLEAVRRHRNGEPRNPAGIVPMPVMVGIGWTEAFDAKAARFQNSYVIISGRVDDKNCTGAGGTDRSYGVMPTDIRTWSPAEGAPANS
jgi:hypothetical protein